jgi:hypothetical protein
MGGGPEIGHSANFLSLSKEAKHVLGGDMALPSRLDVFSSIQLGLFGIICILGLYINKLGIDGGSSSIDSAHIYVVKFSRNAPRYLTETQSNCFNSAVALEFLCLLIFLALVFWRVVTNKK